jgi:hypothetical protein
VKARNQFHSEGRAAKVGPAAFGFTWGAWSCLFLATLMLFLGTALGGSSRNKNQNQRGFRKVQPAGPTAAGGAGAAGAAGAGAGTTAGGGKHIGFWRRQRMRKGRGSFGDNESQLRVKDEYA